MVTMWQFFVWDGPVQLKEEVAVSVGRSSKTARVTA